MKVNTKIDPFLKMANNYKRLKKNSKFQVLSMIMTNGNLQEEVFSNTINKKTKKSVVDNHCERKCFEKFKHYSNNTIFVTIAPCDDCYRDLIKKYNNITSIYYLASKYQENKKSIQDTRVRCVFDTITNEKDIERLKILEKILLKDYYKYVKKLRRKRENEKASKKGGDTNG